MRIHLKKKDRPQKHDVWVTEINIKLLGRRKDDLYRKIPKKLLEKLEEKHHENIH